MLPSWVSVSSGLHQANVRTGVYRFAAYTNLLRFPLSFLATENYYYTVLLIWKLSRRFGCRMLMGTPLLQDVFTPM